jgi:fido (protein-threonine AMPylation protein)
VEGVAEGQFDELVDTVDEWYLAFEWIHPFRDGNGRTGKVLHNWLNGTLDDPVLVSDYFGAGNP